MSHEPFALRKRILRNPVITFQRTPDDTAEEFASFDSRLDANFVESVAKALNTAFRLGYEKGTTHDADTRR